MYSKHVETSALAFCLLFSQNVVTCHSEWCSEKGLTELKGRLSPHPIDRCKVSKSFCSGTDKRLNKSAAIFHSKNALGLIAGAGYNMIEDTFVLHGGAATSSLNNAWVFFYVRPQISP
jgi:hypothetical protein